MSEWQLIENRGRLMFVCDDFENDAAMTLSGDFGDESSRDRFAQSLLARLNTRATDAELERLRWILRQILNDLPTNRDWLDPDVEKVARAALNGEGEG